MQPLLVAEWIRFSMNNNTGSVYGPVYSWRAGQSLGIDLICQSSVCSFNCYYCQLGQIEEISIERRLFIQTEQVMNDFLHSKWQESDIITFSGSGEPTLATNLGETVKEIKKITAIPLLLLTNGAMLGESQVIADCQNIGRVYIKLDATDEAMFQQINRPAPGITLEKVIGNIVKFKKEYPGYTGIQTMLSPTCAFDMEQYIRILEKIQPDEVQLNTPKRPYPRNWHISSRGGHTEELRHYKSTPLRVITPEEANAIENKLRERTGLKIITVYDQISK